MNKKSNTVANVGVTNVITMAASKGVTFVGGMFLSNKTLTEGELAYLREHITMK